MTQVNLLKVNCTEMRKLNILWISVIILIFTTLSCSRTEIESERELSQIAFLIEDFSDDIATKTSTVLDGNNIIYAWEATDTIGIFPNTGYQVAFPIGSQAGDAYAVFNGGGWALKDNANYSAYYPFEYMNKHANQIPLVFTGQVQNGNNLNHIGAFDYMASVPTPPENGSVTFSMKHMGCLVWLNLTMPVVTYISTISISSNQEVFKTAVYLDILDNNLPLTTAKESDHVVLNLKNVSVDSNKLLQAFMMVAPTDIGDAEYKISAVDDAGRVYQADLSTGYNKEFKKGGKKKVSATLSLVSEPGTGKITTGEDIFGEDMVLEIKY